MSLIPCRRAIADGRGRRPIMMTLMPSGISDKPFNIISCNCEFSGASLIVVKNNDEPVIASTGRVRGNPLLRLLPRLAPRKDLFDTA